MDHVFVVDDKATVLKHEQDLRNSEVPVLIMNAAKASYTGFEIRNAKLTEEGGKVSYNLEMRKSKDKVNVIFNPEGKILETNRN
jgi:uncharacterized membrane protein YkoI